MEGKYMYSSTLSLTSVLEESGPGHFTPGKETRYPLYMRLGKPVWTGEENLALTEI
jgi:hypothetical protein